MAGHGRASSSATSSFAWLVRTTGVSPGSPRRSASFTSAASVARRSATSCKEHGVGPAPERAGATWDEFIARHAKTLWARDFLSVRSWTLRGRLDLYLLVFVHVASRRVVVSPATANPTGEWTEQQARNFLMEIGADGELDCTMVLRDRDTKYTAKFDAILNERGTRPKKLPPCSPNLNAYAERFVQTLKHECLNHFIVCGVRHLNYLVAQFVDHYHVERPHQGIGNRTPIAARAGPTTGPVECVTRLGGLLKHYRRAA